MNWIEVKSSGPLRGAVRIQGSKNSSLGLLAASLLADSPVSLLGLPDIYDIRIIRKMMETIGVHTKRNLHGDLHIDPSGLHSGDLDIKLSSSFRASYYFVGALLGKLKRVAIGYPGGDDFVSRPIDQHLKLFKAMGAEVEFLEDSYIVRANRLAGTDLYFDCITSGATINGLLLAVLAKGTTILRNCAVDPEVVDVANLLNQMGAMVRGAGTSTIRIEGVKRLTGVAYAVIPDRLIAGAFLMSVGMNGGEVTVDGVIPEHLESCMAKLSETGLQFTVSDSSITAFMDGPVRPTRVRTAMYPGLATDLQQPMTALLLRAGGKSIMTEKVYPKRFSHVPQLNRLGASIEIRGASAFIPGGCTLRGAHVHAADVRAGTALVLAGLAAEGTTLISGVKHLERGYEDVVGAFRKLGAEIRRVEDTEMPDAVREGLLEA